MIVIQECENITEIEKARIIKAFNNCGKKPILIDGNIEIKNFN